MYEKSCRCGASKKNFSVDIGPFYIAECCELAGYDHKGERLEPEDVGLTKEKVDEIVQSTPELTVEDDPALDAPEVAEEVQAEQPKEEVKPETKAEKKARLKRENQK